MDNREYIVEYDHSNGRILYFVSIDMNNPDISIPPNAIIISDSMRRTIAANMYSWKVNTLTRCLQQVQISEDCDNINILKDVSLLKLKSKCNEYIQNYDANYFDFEVELFRLYDKGVSDIDNNLETSDAKFVRNIASKSNYELEEFVLSIKRKIAKRNNFFSDVIGYYNTLRDQLEKAKTKEEISEVEWTRRFDPDNYEEEVG